MKSNRIIAFALSIAMLITLAGCAGSTSSSSTASTAGKDDKTPSGEPIKIGAVDPLTGAQAIFGQDETRGKKMAIDEINAAGGVLGRPLMLISEDDNAQPAQSATAATKLITSDKVVAISGAHSSGCTLALMEVIAEHGIPTVTPGASSPAITSQGNAWISRGIPDDSLQSRILVKWAKDEDKVTKLGFLYVNDDYGKGGYNAAVAAAADYGIELVAESFMGDDQNFTSQLSKLKDAGCDGLMVWCVYTPGSLIFKQMKEMGWEAPRYAPPGVNNPAVFELSGGAIDGVLLTTGFVLADEDPYVKDWIARYKNLYDAVPSQTSAVGYDSIKIIAEAIERAGTTDAEAVQKEIRATKNFKSLKGSLTINPENGEYECEVRLVRASSEANDFVYLRSYEV